MTESELFEKGLQVRREVLGAEYVDANLAETDEFMMAFQRIVTEWAWGYAWSRPGLDRKTRSMLNLGILTALGRPQELGIYVKGALASGVTVDEIREILIHATVYLRYAGRPPSISRRARGLEGGRCRDKFLRESRHLTVSGAAGRF